MDAGTRGVVLRRLGLARNDLRRGSDRLESAVLVATLALALLVVPIAAAVASSVAGATGAAVAELDARTHPVAARTLETARGAFGPSASPPPVSVAVGWREDGTPHRARTWVPDGTPSGTPVVLRVDPAGAPVVGPTRTDVVGRAAAAGLGVLVVVWALLLTVLLGTRLLLDRARMRAWGTEWEVIEPPWRREQL